MLDADHSHDLSIPEDLYFNDKCWASSDDDDDEIKPPHLWDLVSLALHLILQNPYWARIWIIEELAVSPSSPKINWGDSAVSLEIVLTLADIFCNRTLDDDTLSPHLATASSPHLQLLNTIGGEHRSGCLSDKRDGLQSAELDDLSRLARNAQCSLPQEKVFGLLGLLPQAVSRQIAINYTRSETEPSSEFVAVASVAGDDCGKGWKDTRPHSPLLSHPARPIFVARRLGCTQAKARNIARGGKFDSLGAASHCQDKVSYYFSPSLAYPRGQDLRASILTRSSRLRFLLSSKRRCTMLRNHGTENNRDRRLRTPLCSSVVSSHTTPANLGHRENLCLSKNGSRVDSAVSTCALLVLPNMVIFK